MLEPVPHCPGWQIKVAGTLFARTTAVTKQWFPTFIPLRSHVPYCVDSLILAAVCSADFSNVLST